MRKGTNDVNDSLSVYLFTLPFLLFYMGKRTNEYWEGGGGHRENVRLWSHFFLSLFLNIIILYTTRYQFHSIQLNDCPPARVHKGAVVCSLWHPPAVPCQSRVNMRYCCNRIQLIIKRRGRKRRVLHSKMNFTCVVYIRSGRASMLLAAVLLNENRRRQ